MPGPEELPETLARLPYLNAADVTTGRDFDSHMERIMRFIDRTFAETEARRAREAEEQQPASVTTPAKSSQSRALLIAACVLAATGVAYGLFESFSHGSTAPVVALATARPKPVGMPRPTPRTTHHPTSTPTYKPSARPVPQATPRPAQIPTPRVIYVPAKPRVVYLPAPISHAASTAAPNANPPTASVAASGLAGNWTIFFDNNTQNAIFLTASGDAFSGTYISDNKTACAATGAFAVANDMVTLQISCSTMAFTMEGPVSNGGRAIVGRYTVNGGQSGAFRMAKQ
jgi:hypothetical protein